MLTLAIAFIVTPVGFLAYSYVVYPIALKLMSLYKPKVQRLDAPDYWPEITITVPCYNEEASIAATVESLLALEYPADRRHILVISDASTDQTDMIVRSYASRGVALVRLSSRGGKTAAENAAWPHLKGEIVVNTDATIRIRRGSLGPLVAVFQDPTIGVASGRDLSVGDVQSAANAGESGYVGYEMWIRSLETRLGTIVGASGCFFATRRELYDAEFPNELSRDFASCLVAREHGYRSVSVDSAIALVPRAVSLRSEYRRKVRTMARGLGTLFYKRHLLNPIQFGGFSIMLISHKLSRWLFQLTLPLMAVGAILVVCAWSWAAPWVIGISSATAVVAALAWWWPESRPMPAALSTPGFVIWSNVAGIVAWSRFFRGEYQPVWEPTRRPEMPA